MTRLKNLTDEQLTARFRESETLSDENELLTEIYLRYSAYVLNWSLRLMKDLESSQDVTADVFLELKISGILC